MKLHFTQETFAILLRNTLVVLTRSKINIYNKMWFLLAPFATLERETEEIEDSNINMKISVPCNEQTYHFISYFCNNGNPFGAALLLEFVALHSFKEAIENHNEENIAEMSNST